MGIGGAIEAVKAGLHVRRRAWLPHQMWLALQIPDAHSKMQAPYLYLQTGFIGPMPYTLTNEDILAKDWMAVPD